MYAKLLAAAAGLILGSVAVLAGDNSNSRIPDHQPRQTGTDPHQPKASADGSGVETLGMKARRNRLAPGESNPEEKKPQPDSC